MDTLLFLSAFTTLISGAGAAAASSSCFMRDGRSGLKGLRANFSDFSASSRAALSASSRSKSSKLSNSSSFGSAALLFFSTSSLYSFLRFVGAVALAAVVGVAAVLAAGFVDAARRLAGASERGGRVMSSASGSILRRGAALLRRIGASTPAVPLNGSRFCGRRAGWRSLLSNSCSFSRRASRCSERRLTYRTKRPVRPVAVSSNIAISSVAMKPPATPSVLYSGQASSAPIAPPPAP